MHRMCVVLYRHAVCVGRVECAMYTLMDRCFWGPICHVLLWKNANTIGEQWVRSAVFRVGDRPKNSAEARKLVVIKLTFMQPIRSGDSTDNKCTKHVIQTQSTFSFTFFFGLLESSEKKINKRKHWWENRVCSAVVHDDTNRRLRILNIAQTVHQAPIHRSYDTHSMFTFVEHSLHFVSVSCTVYFTLNEFIVSSTVCAKIAMKEKLTCSPALLLIVDTHCFLSVLRRTRPNRCCQVFFIRPPDDLHKWNECVSRNSE